MKKRTPKVNKDAESEDLDLSSGDEHESNRRPKKQGKSEITADKSSKTDMTLDKPSQPKSKNY